MVDNPSGSNTIYVSGNINSENLHAINIDGTISCNSADVCV